VLEDQTQSIAETTVQIPVERFVLEGTLVLPPGAMGIVLFAHGSGSSRFSPRNRYVASVLHRAPIGTLLLDLLTTQEEKVDEETRQHRFDIGLLADRLVAAIGWLRAQPGTSAQPIGLFGASTGAAAALVAASESGGDIRAVVSRGGRPDLADEALAKVDVPTLLIVGGADHSVLQLNRSALRRLHGRHNQLTTIEGATHLFEERGAIEEVARLATAWFHRYFEQRSGERAH
jgi:putative phosphoribosyl transferase